MKFHFKYANKFSNKQKQIYRNIKPFKAKLLIMEISPLYKAVEYLKRNGVITRDVDIVRDLGVNKGTLSMYINGKQEPSKNFVNKFQEFYKLDLKEFSSGQDRADIKDQLISSLMAQIRLLEERNKDLSERVLTSLEKLQDGQKEILNSITK